MTISVRTLAVSFEMRWTSRSRALRTTRWRTQSGTAEPVARSYGDFLTCSGIGPLRASW